MSDETEPDPFKTQRKSELSPPQSGTEPRAEAETQHQGAAATAPASRVAPEGYEIVDELGRGGMGVVYKARQHKLNRVVALKMVLAGEHASSEMVERFLREAEAAASLRHPNIVQVHDLGEHAGRPYFVMEFIDGTDLQNVRSMPSRRAAEVTESIARGIHFAHLQSIIHRDLKPANILLDRDGTPKITDFGLAKLSRPDSNQDLTSHDQLLGTAPYMPPEQARGDAKHVGPPADIYAVGAILYQLLTGNPPFVGKSTYEILDRVQKEDPTPPRQLISNIPRDLETICLKCLEKAPARRYATAEELADDLRRFLAGEPITARPVSDLERAARWVRRTPAAMFGLMLMAVIVAVLGTQFRDYWLYRRPTESYFRSRVMRNGEFEGVDRLSSAQVKQLNSSYRLTRRGSRGPIVAIAGVNALGKITGTTGLGSLLEAGANDVTQYRVARIDIERNNDDHVVNLTAYDLQGVDIWRFFFTKWPTRGHYTDANGNERSVSGTGATYVDLSYDARGFIKSLKFSDASGQSQSNGKGMFGIEYEIDDAGHQTQITFLGEDGNPTFSDGHARLKQLYKKGLLIEQVCLDPNQRPVFCNRGYSRITFGYDEHGNLIDTNYWGVDDQRTVTSDGIAGIRRELDERFNVTAVRYVDARNQPTVYTPLTTSDAAPGRFCEQRLEYDNRGRNVRDEFRDVDGQLTLNSEGYAIIEREFDGADDLVRWRLFDDQMQPTTNREGVHDTRSSYFSMGRLQQRLFFDTSGAPTRNQLGFAGYKNSYRGNNLVRVERLDEQGLPTLGNDGHAGWRAEYQSGLRTKQVFCGADGEPTRTVDGFAILKTDYDARGNATSYAYFDELERPVLSTAGYHRQRYEYNENNFPGVMRVEDTQGQPTWTNEGYSWWTATYDDNGNQLEKAFFGVDGSPVITTHGYARVTEVFDSRGQALETRLFGEDGLPIASAEGAATITREYDERGRLVADHQYAADGTWLRSAKYTCNARGQVVETLATDEAGQPVEIDGVARDVLERNHNGDIIRHRYFDARGEKAAKMLGIHEIRTDYDKRGNFVQLRFFDRNGQLTPSEHGYARGVQQYDAGGRLVGKSYYDEKGEPFVNSKGLAAIRYENDRFGNQLVVAYLGAEGEPVDTVTGCHQIRQTFERGKPVSIAYFNRDGEPVLSGEGFWRQELVYDDWLHVIERRYLGIDGKLSTQHPWARETTAYDARGNATRSTYYDENGNPETGNWGYVTESSEYDDQNRLVASSVFDANENRVLRLAEPERELPGGYWRHEYRYDRLGQIVEMRFLGTNEERINTTAGYAQIKNEYDRFGNLLSSNTFAADGRQLVQQVRIQVVDAGSVGESLGLQPGDVVVSLDGTPIDSTAAFARLRQSSQQGATAVILRDGEEREIVLPYGRLGIGLDNVPAE